MFCRFCGSAVAEGVHFCPNCGTPTDPAAPVQATPVQSATPFQAPPLQQATSGQGPVTVPPAPPFQAAAPVQAAAAAGAFAPPPPPAAPLQDVGSPASLTGGYGLAGMSERLVASILDMICLGIVYVVVGMATAARLGGVTDSGFSLSGTPAVVAIGTTCVAGFLYYWLAEGFFGSTLGKAIVGIQVRRKTGAPCGIAASLLRNVLRIIDGIGVYLVGFFVAILSKARQRLGDHAAGTVVVDGRIAKSVRILAVLVWLAALVGGLAAAYVIHGGAPETVSGEFAALPSTIPVASTGRLKAGNFAFTEGIGGPARPNAVFKPGDRAFLKYDIAGFARDAQKAPHLSFQLTAADPAGLAIHEPWTTRFDGLLNRGAPVNGSLGLELPSFAPPGKYKITIKVHDEVASANLELTPSFEVNAAEVAAPRGLELRDLQLSRSENGPAESMPAFEVGGTIYMSSNVFGLQFRDGRTTGRMSLKMLGPDGRVALDQPDYLDLSQSQFYRPPTYWIHVRGELPIPSGLQKGIYTQYYAVMDNVSNQTITQEVKFEVR